MTNVSSAKRAVPKIRRPLYSLIMCHENRHRIGHPSNRGHMSLIHKLPCQCYIWAESRPYYFQSLSCSACTSAFLTSYMDQYIPWHAAITSLNGLWPGSGLRLIGGPGEHCAYTHSFYAERPVSAQVYDIDQAPKPVHFPLPRVLTESLYHTYTEPALLYRRLYRGNFHKCESVFLLIP